LGNADFILNASIIAGFKLKVACTLFATPTLYAGITFCYFYASRDNYNKGIVWTVCFTCKDNNNSDDFRHCPDEGVVSQINWYGIAKHYVSMLLNYKSVDLRYRRWRDKSREMTLPKGIDFNEKNVKTNLNEQSFRWRFRLNNVIKWLPAKFFWILRLCVKQKSA